MWKSREHDEQQNKECRMQSIHTIIYESKTSSGWSEATMLAVYVFDES
mgnify:CR=1 FL=1